MSVTNEKKFSTLRFFFLILNFREYIKMEFYEKKEIFHPSTVHMGK
jgi:hypothetical protein